MIYFKYFYNIFEEYFNLVFLYLFSHLRNDGMWKFTLSEIAALFYLCSLKSSFPYKDILMCQVWSKTDLSQ